MMPAHSDKHYESELRQLKEELLSMGAAVEEMIHGAMKALVQRDSKVAEIVIKKDPEVNALEMQIDAHCVELLALHQPAASDLRFVTSGLKITKDLERMGDHSVNLSQDAIDLNKESQLKPYIHLPQIAEKAQKMVRDSLDAFVNQDVKLATQVCKDDDIVDNLKDQVFVELIQLMKTDAQVVDRCLKLLSVAKHLERIADHATNICEEVIFMVTGDDIRHKSAAYFQKANS